MSTSLMLRAAPDSARANHAVVARLEEIADLLEAQGASVYRARAYRRAADTVRTLDRPVADILEKEGLAGLDALPTIGPSTARAILDFISTGRHSMLDRLRGASDPIALLSSVPGIGPVLAGRLHDDADIETLEQLEAAAHDGRLAAMEGFGAKRVRGIRDALAARLGRTRRTPAASPISSPTVTEILDVDAEYLAGAQLGSLPKIAPRRFNPEQLAWLPVLHTTHGDRHYTALFSNTALAHQLHRTNDWVVIYFDGPHGEHQHTVITETSGPLTGRRVVRGREPECEVHYGRSKRH